MIREYFIRTNGFRWITILPQLMENFNTMRNGTTRYSPNQLWIPESYPPDDADENNVPISANEEQRQLVKQRIEEHAEKTKGKDILYNVGTLVRVKMTSLYSKVRADIKQGKKKYIVVNYSPEIFRIKSIKRQSNAGLENTVYFLEHLNGRPVITEQKMNKPNKERR